eukprot:Skav234016  [mRNA]  locus=scaffold3484:138632:143749:- [translate_table: standard]
MNLFASAAITWLCPSVPQNRPALSFFKPCPPEEKYQRPLRELQKHVEATLQLAMKMGKGLASQSAFQRCQLGGGQRAPQQAEKIMDR